MNKTVGIFFVFVLVIYSSASYSGNSLIAEDSFVTNGEFEIPVVANQDDLIRFFAGQSFEGWTVIAGNVDVQRGFGGGPCGVEDQYLDLTGLFGASNAGTIVQMISTVPGNSYELSFAVDCVNNDNGVPTGLNVFWENELVAPTIFEDDPGYAHYFFPITSSMPNSELRFQSINGDGFGPLLDDVVLVESIQVGDVNCDGSIDLLDVAPFVDLLTMGGFDAKADINQDGEVNLLDVAPFIDLLAGG